MGCITNLFVEVIQHNIFSSSVIVAPHAQAEKLRILTKEQARHMLFLVENVIGKKEPDMEGKLCLTTYLAAGN